MLVLVWWCWLRFGEATAATRRAVSDVGFVLTPAVASWCGWRAARRAPEAARAWSWLATGCAIWSAASVVWAVSELLFHRLAPFPSYADIGYIGYATPMVVGLLALPRARRVRTSRLRANLDVALIVSSLLFVSWTLVLSKVEAVPTAHQWYRLDAWS